MTYFRRYLIALKRAQHDGLFIDLRFFLGVLAALSVILSLVVDWLLPANLLTNGIKGVVAIIGGFLIFSASFLIASLRTDAIMDRDRYYNPVRKRFSHKQRVNISVVGFIISLFIILLGSPESPIYTLKSSLFIAFSLTLLAFVRRYRDEFIRDIHEIPDVRDLPIHKKKMELKEKSESKQ